MINTTLELIEFYNLTNSPRLVRDDKGDKGDRENGISLVRTV